MNNKYLRRSWTEIDLDALRDNFLWLSSFLDDKTKMCAVVKADCYGHGVPYCLPILEKAGADFYAVSNIEEALEVRDYTDKDILILGHTPVEYAKALADNNISQAVMDLDYACELNAAAEGENVRIKAHIKVDSGMCRIGLMYYDSEQNADSVDDGVKIASMPCLDVEGIFTHFANSDDLSPDNYFTKHQFEQFTDFIAQLEKRGVTFKYKHCCNSAGIIRFKNMQLDMVRAGILMYGLLPSFDLEKAAKEHIKPVMTLKTAVVMIKEIEKGVTIGYGRTYTASSHMKIATLPIGYADGYPRLLSNKGYVMIKGRKAPIVGNVCMDQMMVDVTDIDGVKVGDECLLFGKSPDGELSADTLTSIYGTIGYELVCNLGKRLPRIYFEQGKEIGMLDIYK